VSPFPQLGEAPADLTAFLEAERQVLLRRWRLFAPMTFVLFALTEVAAHFTPEFPKEPLLTGAMLALMVAMYVLARLDTSRRVIGIATVVTGIVAAGYIATAAAETGRFHSPQVLAMAVLLAMVPGILSLTLYETTALMVGSIVAYALVCRYWKAAGPVEWAGAATNLIYLVFLSVVIAVSVASNRRLRRRELVARREVERVHRFAVEEVLQRHLPPRYVKSVLSGERPLDAPPERRTITVVFADIVQFTPLSEALKPEELAGLMAKFYDITAQVAFEHGATIDKFIGDAVMAILGAPEAMSPEDQARRAVAVAQGWHHAVRDLDGRRLSLRIGVHQDVVAVGLFGGKLRSDYTVLGRGVNIAARLEQRCRPGEIVVSDEVLRRMSSDGLTVKDLGELELKGIPAPVRCHCIVPAEAPARVTRSQ
jgi:class 3 adenylate cyclase